MTNKSHLFAHLFRLRNIKRWSLMNNLQQENVAEHILNMCYIVHALCSIANTIYGKNVATEKLVIAAMMHNVTELFTGDLPTPLKLQDDDILTQFRYLEELAAKRIMGMVPDELKEVYSPLLINKDPEVTHWIKAADLCDAYLKCKSELAAGNKEFASSERQIRILLYQLNMPEVDCFLKMFAPSFDMTLNEITNTSERLTEEMLPPLSHGIYEENVENEVIHMLHLLVEEGYFVVNNEYELAQEIVDGVQRFLNERGVRHVVFTRDNDVHVHLIE